MVVTVRLMQQNAQLMLKPLFFEVPLLESDPLFTGRQWLMQELKSLIEGSSPGALISGSPGTGKTALVLQLVDHSCFGRKRPSQLDADEERQESSLALSTARVNVQQTNEKVFIFYFFCKIFIMITINLTTFSLIEKIKYFFKVLHVQLN